LRQSPADYCKKITNENIKILNYLCVNPLFKNEFEENLEIKRSLNLSLCRFSPWTYECRPNKICAKKMLSEMPEPKKVQSLAVCKMLCDPYANLWPRPSGSLDVAKTLTYLDPTKVSLVAKGTLSAKMSTLIANLEKYAKALVIAKTK